MISLLTSACLQKKDIRSPIESADQNLKILLSDPVETLDPMRILYSSDWKVANTIFEGIVTINQHNELIYKLIDTAIIRSNNLEYIFYLRNNVFFHDNPCFPKGKGKKLSSYDIKYVFERLANSGNHFSNYSILNNSIEGVEEYHMGKSDHISGIEIIDSLKFKITLIKPNNSFLMYLTSPNFYIIPQEAVSYYGETLAFNPVGTGPFRMSEFNKYERIVLVKNENYYLDDENGTPLPYLETIEFRNVKETENRFTELIHNNSHFIYANHEEYRYIQENQAVMRKFKIVKIDKGEGVRYWAFYFNNNRKDNEYKKLRIKIAKSFNRDFLLNLSSGYKIAFTLVPEFHVGINKNSWMSNHSFNEDIKFEDLKYPDTINIMANMEYTDLYELEKTLTKLNLPFKRVIKSSDYYSSIHDKKPTLFRVSMLPSFPDPLEYYSLFYSKSSSKINLSNFSDEHYDRIYESLISENDQAKRMKFYQKLEKILMDEVAALYLSHVGAVHFIHVKNLLNVDFNYNIADFSKSYFIHGKE